MNLDLKRAYEQSIRWAREHTQNLRNEILEYRKSMEEDIAIADIKVQMEGDGKVQKEKQEVDQKGGPERWTRKVDQKREMPFCTLSPAMGISLPEKSLAL